MKIVLLRNIMSNLDTLQKQLDNLKTKLKQFGIDERLKKAAKFENRVANTIKLYYRVDNGESRLIIKTPQISNEMFVSMLKEAGRDTSGQTGTYDDNTGEWSFSSGMNIVLKIKKVLGDFFPRASILNEYGVVTGKLPKSTLKI